MAKTQYINKSGSVLLHHADGQVVPYGYGDPVDPDDLADYQKATLSRFASDKDLGIHRETTLADLFLGTVDDSANFRAAMADAGQPNSTSSPVPSNYDQLTPDERARFVRVLENNPGQQAAVVAHELRNDGDDEVVGVAPDRVVAAAKAIIKGDDVGAGPDVVSPGQAEAEPTPTSVLPPPSGSGKLTGDALKERASELDIEGRSDMNADELRDAVAKAEADQAGA